MRLGLVMLLAYLASPIDLVSDFLPVVGHADDIIVAVLVLRWAMRRAGLPTMHAHWPGSPDGFAALCRLIDLPRHPAP